MEFETIKETAARLSEAYINGLFDRIYQEEFSTKKISATDFYAIVKLGDVYIQTMRGTLSRSETIRQQKDIEMKWQEMKQKQN